MPAVPTSAGAAVPLKAGASTAKKSSYATAYQSGWVKHEPGAGRAGAQSQLAGTRSLVPAVSPERRVEVLLCKNALGVKPAVRKVG